MVTKAARYRQALHNYDIPFTLRTLSTVFHIPTRHFNTLIYKIHPEITEFIPDLIPVLMVNKL
jgi:hypothetical protein